MNPNRRKSSGRRSEERKRENEREGTPSLTEWLAVKLDIPADVLDGGIRLDMRGRNTLTVHGCCGILDFSPCEIRLSLGNCALAVRGERLICTAYLAGAVSIEGWITAICFEEGEVRV